MFIWVIISGYSVSLVGSEGENLRVGLRANPHSITSAQGTHRTVPEVGQELWSTQLAGWQQACAQLTFYSSGRSPTPFHCLGNDGARSGLGSFISVIKQDNLLQIYPQANLI